MNGETTRDKSRDRPGTRNPVTLSPVIPDAFHFVTEFSRSPGTWRQDAPFVLAIPGARESTLVRRINSIGKPAFLPIARRAMRLGDTAKPAPCSRRHVVADADIDYVHGADADWKKGVPCRPGIRVTAWFD